MKFILQIDTGPWHAEHNPPEDIVRSVRKIASLIPVDKVIIGWNTDPSLYRTVGEYLHQAGIRMILWLPVFAGTGEVCRTDRALDLYGNPVATPARLAGEAFVFDCPSSRRNIRATEDLYEKYFSGCGFDGVFLDRIRSQSFVSGVPGVLSCGCERCRKQFLDRGVDPDAVRELYETKKNSFFDMARYPMDGQFVLKEKLAQRFFEVKEAIIAGAVAELCRFFRAKGLIVGLDLFAPVISRFVGQNYALVAQHADFIKPMLYRRTEAPAGIGYEYSLFEKYVPDARGRAELALDEVFLETQMEAVGKVPCEKYPGVEINYNEALVRTDAAYIAEFVTAVGKHGFEGAALCWNVMRAPDAYIEAAAGACI